MADESRDGITGFVAQLGRRNFATLEQEKLGGTEEGPGYFFQSMEV